MYFHNITAWTVLAWLIAIAWVGIIIVFVRACRQRLTFRPTIDALTHTNLPKLSVIVAARNETDCIETCIRSLFQQNYPNFEVIAVNDRSTDDTPEILNRLTLEFKDRLKVFHVSTLPAGWFGKPHALTLGLQSATGSHVLFTDADCTFQSPFALASTVAELERRNLDLFSIAAMYKMTSLRERIAVPCCSEVLVTWLHPERVDDPRWPDAFANGAYMLVRKKPFEEIGGWGSVRTKISEDLQLARLAKSSGLRVGVAHGEGFYETRSYRTFRDSWNGWSRIFKGALSPAQLFITVARMMILFVLPLFSMLYGIFDLLSSGHATWLTQGPGLALAIAFGLRCTMDLMMFRLVGSTMISAALAPIGRFFVMASATHALFSHAGLVNTHWRGATFSAGQMVMSGRHVPTPRVQ